MTSIREESFEAPCSKVSHVPKDPWKLGLQGELTNQSYLRRQITSPNSNTLSLSPLILLGQIEEKLPDFELDIVFLTNNREQHRFDSWKEFLLVLPDP